MGDIATLGIRIDSTQAVTATTNLNQLGAAAKTASGASTALTVVTKDAATAHSGMSTQAMAAQHSIRSLVEALASGQPITQALSQQINHLSYAASGPSGLVGAFKQATGALFGLLSPTTLIIGGIAAVGGGFAYALHSIAETGKAFDDTARSAGTTTEALHGLASAAAFKGIDNAEFLKAMDKFGASVYDAQHNMGSLAELMRANGKSASDFNGYMGRTADLIKNAVNDQQRLKILQDAGLPATMDWVRFMSQGADGIKRATEEAVKFGDSAEAQLIAKARKFDEEWAKTFTNFGNGFKNAILSGKGYLDDFGGTVNSWLMKLGVNVGKNVLTDALRGGPTVGSKLSATSNVDDFYSKLGKGAPGNDTGPAPKTTADRQKEISDRQTLIGLYGQSASAEQAAQQVQNAADATFLSTGVSVGQKKIDQLKELTRQQTLGITAIKANTDAQIVDAQTVGMSTGQAAAYAAQQTAINDAKRRGSSDYDTNTVAGRANLEMLRQSTDALGAAAQNADLMKSAYAGLVQGPMQAFTSAISQGATAMDALKKAGISALNALATKLTDMAAQNLWGNAFGGSSSGGLGGILGSLFGGATGAVNGDGTIAGAVGMTSVGGVALHHSGYGPGDTGGASRVVDMSMFARAPRFHTGIGPGETPAIIRQDESVLTPGQMKALGNGGNTHVTVGVTVDDSGNLQAYVKNVSQQAAVDGVNAFAKSPAFVDHVGAATNKAKTRRIA